MDTAIVLAAGLGRKVWPYGEFRQKCTIPVANKPIVRRVVENLLEAGCQRIVVVVGHHAQQVPRCPCRYTQHCLRHTALSGRNCKRGVDSLRAS